MLSGLEVLETWYNECRGHGTLAYDLYENESTQKFPILFTPKEVAQCVLALKYVRTMLEVGQAKGVDIIPDDVVEA